MSQYIDIGACCTACSKLGDAGTASSFSLITLIEVGLAGYGAYCLLNSKPVAKLIGRAGSSIKRRSSSRRRR